MSSDPAFLFYSGDCLKDVQFMSLTAQGVYLQLICAHMSNICVDKNDVDQLLDQLDPKDQRAIQRILIQVPGGFQIPWVATSINKRRAYSESRKANRAKGRQKSQRHMSNISPTYVGHMVNENENVNENINETESETEIWPTFVDFWDAYDKKVGKQKCEPLWKKLSQKTRTDVMAHLEQYIPNTPEKNYRKDPATYLRNKGWEDEIYQNPLNTKTNGNKNRYAELESALGYTSTPAL